MSKYESINITNTNTLKNTLKTTHGMRSNCSRNEVDSVPTKRFHGLTERHYFIINCIPKYFASYSMIALDLS